MLSFFYISKWYLSLQHVPDISLKGSVKVLVFLPASNVLSLEKEQHKSDMMACLNGYTKKMGSQIQMN